MLLRAMMHLPTIKAEFKNTCSWRTGRLHKSRKTGTSYAEVVELVDTLS